jgi:hypothetical protein
MARQYPQTPHCILATRSVIEVLKRFDVAASPMPVILVIHNAAFARFHEERGDYRKAVKTAVIHYAWGFRMNPAQPLDSLGGNWQGHLVADCGDTFIDANISSYKRTDFGIDPGSWFIVRIPPKVNADSEGNANGIPGRRRTVHGAQRRWHLDCARSVRLRQEKPIRSEAKVGCC